MKKLINKISVETLHYAILLQAGIAMAGSLFFSEVMALPPCVLCWYQRIAMYPIVILTTIGIIRNDKKTYISVLALGIPGLAISIYLSQSSVLENTSRKCCSVYTWNILHDEVL